jgi:hypothetical protein
MLFKVLKHFKTDIQCIVIFALGIAIGQDLDKSYVIITLWIGLIASIISAVIGFIELKKMEESNNKGGNQK